MPHLYFLQKKKSEPELVCLYFVQVSLIGVSILRNKYTDFVFHFLVIWTKVRFSET